VPYAYRRARQTAVPCYQGNLQGNSQFLVFVFRLLSQIAKRLNNVLTSSTISSGPLKKTGSCTVRSGYVMNKELKNKKLKPIPKFRSAPGGTSIKMRA
jgi:hypothetical protein